MSNPCRICADPERAEQARVWVTAGITDREIARRLGVDKSSVARHRTNHILTPMRQQIELLEKGAGLRRERAQLAAAAASDNPSTQDLVAAHLSLQSQIAKLEAVEQRLERMATQAESGRVPSAVAQLSAQQLKSIQVGGQLAQLPGFVPARAADQVGRVGPRFAVSIIFTGAGRQETIALAPTIDGREDDGRADHDVEVGAEIDSSTGDARAPHAGPAARYQRYTRSLPPTAASVDVAAIARAARRAARVSDVVPNLAEADDDDPRDPDLDPADC